MKRAPSPALLPLLSALFASTAVAQVNIDTFATNQGPLADPPGGATGVTGGADIIDGDRGLVIDLLTGAGPASVNVTGGALTLTVTDTTPNSRGEARLSWDNDTNPLVLNPIGLGAENLTAGGASGFRIRVNSSTLANNEIEMTVHTNATSSSRASRVLPVVGAAQNFFIAFAEFVQAGTSAADFTSVGAIEMTVRAREGTLALDEVVTALPVLASTKVDALLVDNDSDTRADPGDRVRYTVTITNTGSQATSVDLSDNVDANTTLVAGSTSSTPVARNDQYLWFGNVNLTADGTPFPLLLANDQDPDGDPVTISVFDASTAQGGTVTGVNLNTGEFTYNPPAGFKGVDSFNYTIVDNDAHTNVASATITLSGVVWFVDDSNNTPPHLGTLNDPFQVLASLNGSDPDEPGDIIFLFDDDGTPHPGGHVLEANQEFHGEGTGLILGGTTIVAAGGTPQMTHAAGHGITLAANNTIRGLDVTGTSGAGVTGASFGTLTANTVNVTSTGGTALDLATGTLAATFGTLSSTGAGGQRGIQLVSVTGSLTATTASLTNPTSHGIRVATSPAVVLDFGNTTIIDNAIGSGPTATGIDVATGNTGASFTFDSLAVTTDAGGGLLANASGTINIAGTGNTINATGGPAVDIVSTSLGSGATFSTLSSTNSTGTGVNLDTVTGSFTANGGSISGPSGNAFDLNAGSANVTYAGSISNTANANLIEVSGRTGGTVTFSGNLSSTSNGNGIDVFNNNASGSPIINFSGGTKTLDTGADAAVTLDNNDVATINFTGGNLDIDTTTGTGFNAVNGATAVTVQGTENSVNSTSATALNVNATTIGAADLNFESISSGNNTAAADPVNGIVLNNTGSVGELIVTGDGSANSGGTIQGTTGVGISLTNTRNVSFNNLNIQNTEASGIQGTQVVNFTFTDGTINDSGFPGLNAEPDESNIGFNVTPGGTENNVSGVVTITGSTFTNAGWHGIDIQNFSGTLTDLVITGNTLTSTTNVVDTKGSAIRIGTIGSSGNVANLTKATIANNIINFFPSGAGIQVIGGNSSLTGPGGTVGTPGSGTDIISITGNRVAGQANATNQRIGTHAINVSPNGGNPASRSQGNFNISNNGTVANPLTNIAGIVIGTGNNGNVTATYTIDGNVIVANNTVGSSGIGGGNGIVGAASDTPVMTATVTNNSVSNTDGNGILMVGRGVTGTLNVGIRNNTVGAPLAGVRPGIRVDAGNASSVDDSVCVEISNNTSGGSGGHPGIGLRKQGTAAGTNDFGIEGFAGGACAPAEVFVSSQNPGAVTGTLLFCSAVVQRAGVIAGDNFVSCSSAP